MKLSCLVLALLTVLVGELVHPVARFLRELMLEGQPEHDSWIRSSSLSLLSASLLRSTRRVQRELLLPEASLGGIL